LAILSEKKGKKTNLKKCYKSINQIPNVAKSFESNDLKKFGDFLTANGKYRQNKISYIFEKFPFSRNLAFKKKS